ncbi:LAMI_0E07360g1_1 [Lachancea mirantina]|uniref:Mediator of RNA polymerase II transcription subunit 8 n=1 Tax=Lachancea mirantina TaxID=1230905 RepID=A0A1G4JML1_9SACH|nr:LAMI_0E07360g1_1 [Lachancea mirantina]
MATNSAMRDVSVPNVQEDIKYDFKEVPTQALDAIRMRLAQLTHSLAKMRDDMSRAELPQWHSLQLQVSVVVSQLHSLASTLRHFEETLDATVVVPLPNFPTTAHEGLLTTLLRKKNIPEVDEWINDAKESSGLNSTSATHAEIQKSIQEDEKITAWALDFIKAEQSNYSLHGLHTASELSEGVAPVSSVNYSVNANKHKPQRPFEFDNVLRSIYQGS